MNPETRPYLEDQSFRAMLNMVSANPSMLSAYMHDRRFAKALEVGLGLSFPTGGEDAEDGPGLSAATGARDVPSKATKPVEPEPEMGLSEEEKAERAEKEQKEKSEKEQKEKAMKVHLNLLRCLASQETDCLCTYLWCHACAGSCQVMFSHSSPVPNLVALPGPQHLHEHLVIRSSFIGV
jgi:ferredoxin